MQRAALGLGERRREDLAGAIDRRRDRATLRRAGVHDDRVRADTVADPLAAIVSRNRAKSSSP
jgi:hypothetical protein